MDNNIKLHLNETTKETMKKRNITEEDLKKTITNAETTGEKLYQPQTNRHLAKLKINEATIYADYTTEKDTYKINTTYKHKAVIKQ
jgi:hypothetical protein